MPSSIRGLSALIFVFAAALTGCKSGSSSSGNSPAVPEPGHEGGSAVMEIRSLSGEPSLLSGGNALIELVLADPALHDGLQVFLNGEDASGEFALRSDGRIVGLVSNMQAGENLLEARAAGGDSGARLSLVNHPSSGPIFSGPQLQPWACAQPERSPVTLSDPQSGRSGATLSRESGLDQVTDSNCEAPPQISYYYQPVSAPSLCRFDISGDNPCFAPYRPGAVADADIARFTNDQGDSVRSILAVQKGTLNRGMYSLVVFHDPEAAHHPAEPQRGWNGKLVMEYAGSAGASRFQTAAGSPFFNQNALRKGYMLAVTSLTDHGINSNPAIAAETVMMLKELITETYGEIRFTIGTGGSGGAITQLSMAANYPGLLDGLIPSMIYPDALSLSLEIADCGLFSAEYLPRAGILWTPNQITAVSGHRELTQCAAWVLSFLPLADPARSLNCGPGFPDELVYGSSNPQGVRCAFADHNRNLLGRFTDADGVTRTFHGMDNTGVQYGLGALTAGDISTEQFVRLNEEIGHYDLDQDHVSGPQRFAATVEQVELAYRSGMVTHGRYLARTPIIDVRYDENDLDIHLNWRALSLRERLAQANGQHDNHVIWAYGGSSSPFREAFEAMDAWLAAIEADTSGAALQQKVAANRPVGDQCLVNGVDVGLFSAACPVRFGQSPRQVAGGPVSEDIIKCQLKPLDFASADYAEVQFSAQEQQRLATVFPTGVCDWTRPGVAQQPPEGWLNFANGPGGEAMELNYFQR
jgi:hypothetical protein